jgi:chromosome segregation ATPase
VDALQARLATLEGSLAAATAELDAAVAARERTIAALRAEVSTLQAAAAKLHGDGRRQARASQTYTDQIGQLQAKLHSCELAADEMVASQTALQSKLAAVRAKLATEEERGRQAAARCQAFEDASQRVNRELAVLRTELSVVPSVGPPACLLVRLPVRLPVHLLV